MCELKGQDELPTNKQNYYVLFSGTSVSGLKCWRGPARALDTTQFDARSQGKNNILGWLYEWQLIVSIWGTEIESLV